MSWSAKKRPSLSHSMHSLGDAKVSPAPQSAGTEVCASSWILKLSWRSPRSRSRKQNSAMPTETLPLQAPAATRGSRADMERLRDLIYQVAGIFHADHRFGFLEDRCNKRLEQTGCGSLRDYY